MFKNFFKNKDNKKTTQSNHSRGVTLIELLVVISIFMVISSITIFSYGKFNSSLSIQNLADDIALSVRRAQGYAIGVRGLNDIFDHGYGVHFTANPSSSIYAGSNKSFILFTDIDDNSRYDNSTSICGVPVTGDECLELLSIISTDNILEIYINDSTLISETSTIDVLFNRPNPEPIFCYRIGGSGSCDTNSISGIKIKIATDADPLIYKIITISNNGQISVSN
jgi:prepilin-type N-terminal cleavage/methylation domain-containing protein